jgi:hypothetical protein
MGEAAAGDPVSRLAHALTELYEAAGRPPHSELKRQGQAQDPEVKLPSSTLNDWLRGKSPPADVRVFRWLVDYLKNKARRRGGNYVAPPPATWDHLRKQALEYRRSNRGGRPAHEQDTGGVAGPDARETPGPPVKYNGLNPSAGARSARLHGTAIAQCDPVALGVHRAIGGEPLPTYVHRLHDDVLNVILNPVAAANRLVHGQDARTL